MTIAYDTHTDEYYKEVDMIGAPAALIPDNIKIQILNNLKVTLEELLNTELLKEEPNDIVVVAIQTNLSILEDAYKIDLYKFQFKALTNILNVEIKNIKDLINLT